MIPIRPNVLRAGLQSPIPVYVYDLKQLKRQCRRLLALNVKRKRVFFATMANDHPNILKCIRDCGLGVFVNSMRHLRLVQKIGFSPNQIVYAASNMTLAELRTCVRTNVNLVLDSLGQLRDLAKLVSSGCEIGLRVNVGSSLDGQDFRPDPSYRFGLLPSELDEAVAIGDRAGIRIVGAHSYFGTGFVDFGYLLKGLQSLGSAAAAHFPDLRYLDVGGGFGIPDQFGGPEFDIDGYGRHASQIMTRLERKLGRQLFLYVEPGRYVTADCGFFFTRVVDCKPRSDRIFVGTNASVAGFPRPLMYPGQARHPCQVVGSGRKNSGQVSLPMFICGNSTYSQDFLARDISLPPVMPGDCLVFHNAGAYGRSMISRFLGKHRPSEVVIDS